MKRKPPSAVLKWIGFAALHLSYSLLGLICLSFTAYGTNLNDPVSHTPTVGSEILRGKRAAFSCWVDNLPRPLDALGCLSEANRVNQQSKGNPEPFSVGLFFGGWFFADASVYIESKGASNPRSAEWRKAAIGLFHAFREYQTRLGLTDDQVIAAALIADGAKPGNVKERMAYWSQY